MKSYLGAICELFHNQTRCTVEKSHINCIYLEASAAKKGSQKHYFMANNIVYHWTEFMLIFFCVLFHFRLFMATLNISVWIFLPKTVCRKKMLLLRSVKMNYDRGMLSPEGKLYVPNLCFCELENYAAMKSCAIVTLLWVWKSNDVLIFWVKVHLAGSYWILKGLKISSDLSCGLRRVGVEEKSWKLPGIVNIFSRRFDSTKNLWGNCEGWGEYFIWV